jgi:hypothetical protein
MADLPDEEVRDLVERLETLLARMEQATGPVADLAARTVEALVTVYGTALGRVMALAGGTPLASSVLDDELLRHLLLLHGLHPEPVEERIRRALGELRPHLADVDLDGIEDGVARLRWSRGGRGCSASAEERAIADAVLAAAPELCGVRAVSEQALIPVESLLRRPGGTA